MIDNNQDWKMEKLGSVAKVIMGQSPDSKYYSQEENGMPFLQGCADFGNIFPRHKQYCSQIKKIAETGSILFSVRAPVGRINTADRSFVIGRGLASILATQIDQSYLRHYLKYNESKFHNATQGSTFESINSTELNQWPIELPRSRLEQSKIAEILETVDCSIEQTEVLIAKKQRIKTGLIQDLLTKGIDEHGNIRSEDKHEFKESPLGRIPVEWNTTALGYITELVTSGSRGWAKYYSVEGDYFLRIGNLTREHINLRFDDVVYVQPTDTSEGKRTAVETGDILISITADLGIIGVIPESFGTGYVNQHIALVRLLKESVNPRFIGWFLSSNVGQIQFDTANESGAKAGLNLTTVNNLTIPIIDIEEQNKIVVILDQITQEIDSHIKALNKLKLLKTALMQDLLTGQKRVTPLLKETEVNH